MLESTDMTSDRAIIDQLALDVQALSDDLRAYRDTVQSALDLVREQALVIQQLERNLALSRDEAKRYARAAVE